MNLAGLALCSRYSYPPNSLSLCGPAKQTDLKWYSAQQQADRGALEILSQFSTLFPYLRLIASENGIEDPFNPKVVEAYWLGNNLLYQVCPKPFIQYLSETLTLRKKIKRKDLEQLVNKVLKHALPHHSFHVVNIYERTGHLDIPHTVETMDACLINWGKVKKILPNALVVDTKPLIVINTHLGFDKMRERTIISQGEKDILFHKLQIGDWVSYHWGYFCQKLTSSQLRNLIYYTNFSLSLTL